MHPTNEELQRRVEQVERRLDEHDDALAGEKGDFGIALKVNLLWKLATVLACAAGGGIGVWFTKIVQGMLKP